MSDQPAPAGVPTCYRHPDRESHIRCQRCGRAICPDCMRDAAVGFQCPDCVAEGRQATRSGRSTYGGLRPTNAMTTSIVLIGLNVAVWVAVLATGGSGGSLLDWIALHARGFCNASGGSFAVTESVCTNAPGTTWIPGVSDGAYWQLITSAFTHEAIWHIGFNMLALYVLGPQLEMVLGRARYLALYLLSALAGSTLVYWASPAYQSTIGASGAVFGLMGALLVVALKMRANPQQILLWIGINFVLTLVNSHAISWQGHLGGFLGGVAIAAILVFAPRQRRTTYQLAGLIAIGLLLLVAIIARTLTLT